MIKKFQGISPSTLTLMLKQLQEENLIERQVLDGSSTKITYTITSKGKKLLEIVLPLLEWIKSQKNQEIHDSFIECMS